MMLHRWPDWDTRVPPRRGGLPLTAPEPGLRRIEVRALAGPESGTVRARPNAHPAPMHYTQQPSRVTSETNTAASVLYARMQGLISGPMLREELRGWDERYGERLPAALLLDLRDVAGYGPGTPSAARKWLLGAEERGVERIAFVASSSVIRTIVRVVSPDVNVSLRCFLSDQAAIDWLEGRFSADKKSKANRTDAAPRPRPRPRP